MTQSFASLLTRLKFKKALTQLNQYKIYLRGSSDHPCYWPIPSRECFLNFSCVNELAKDYNRWMDGQTDKQTDRQDGQAVPTNAGTQYLL